MADVPADAASAAQQPRLGDEGRSGWLSNSLLVAASALFLVLLGNYMVNRFA